MLFVEDSSDDREIENLGSSLTSVYVGMLRPGRYSLVLTLRDTRAKSCISSLLVAFDLEHS